MKCNDCTTAEARAGHWPIYTMNCPGCNARAAARSQAAIEAFEYHHWDSLDEMLGRLFPEHQKREAFEAVRRWWRIDHPEGAHSAKELHHE